ncbi:MAG: HD-GYP domain-containing protein [Spirochaetes bacterium]|nr:HD-GYP domain-containing protein [Spirochaetota bacterium]
MRQIKTKDLHEGMRFDKPVYIDGENILVPPGIPLKQKDIDRLLKWEIEEVQTEGQLIRDISDVLKGSGGEEKLWEIPREKEYVRVYLSSIEKMSEIFADIRDKNDVFHSRIDNLLNELLTAVKEHTNEMIQLTIFGGIADNKFSRSAVNCTVLSTVIGMTLKIISHRLIQIATGALLHDVGMLRVPSDILDKKDKLAPDELNQIRTHPIHSYRIITQQLKYPETIAAIALQHHERWDGNGYPRKLHGNDILLSSRIVSVADAYEAMISERPYRNSMIGYSAMKAILSDNGRMFDPTIIKAFLNSMGIFPIGSIVQLNDSSIGRVIETHTAAPLRPRLELIIDEYGDKYAETQVVDLLKKKNLFIVKAIDLKELNEGSGLEQ